VNRDDLYNSFSEIDDYILERSETTPRSRKSSAWLRWGIMAACLCIAAVAAIPHFFNDDPVVPVGMGEEGTFTLYDKP